MLTTAIAFFVALLISSIYCKCSPKHRIRCNDEGWLPIETLNEKEKDYLITDGEIVDSMILTRYNKDGKVVFYSGRIATHWRRFPLPPQTLREYPCKKTTDAPNAKAN